MSATMLRMAKGMLVAFHMNLILTGYNSYVKIYLCRDLNSDSCLYGVKATLFILAVYHALNAHSVENSAFLLTTNYYAWHLTIIQPLFSQERYYLGTGLKFETCKEDVDSSQAMLSFWNKHRTSE